MGKEIKATTKQADEVIKAALSKSRPTAKSILKALDEAGFRIIRHRIVTFDKE